MLCNNGSTIHKRTVEKAAKEKYRGRPTQHLNIKRAEQIIYDNVDLARGVLMNKEVACDWTGIPFKLSLVNLYINGSEM